MKNASQNASPLKIVYNVVDSEATGCYRILNPLYELRRLNLAEIQTLNTEDMRDQLEWADILFLQCLVGPQQIENLKKVKQSRVKVVIDYDENLEDLSETICKKLGMTAQEIQSNWIQYLQLADLVTVPTKKLAEVVGKYTKKVSILPNLLESRTPTPNKKGDGVRIMYSCSDSHLENILWLGPVLKFIGERYPQTIIVSHGNLNFTSLFPKYTGRAKHYLHSPYKSYYQEIADIAPDVWVAPLLDTSYNNCKSNLKYLQAGNANAVLIASGGEAFQRTKAILVNNKITWTWYLRKLILDSTFRDQIASKINQDVKNYLLTNHIQYWHSTFSSLAS